MYDDIAQNPPVIIVPELAKRFFAARYYVDDSRLCKTGLRQRSNISGVIGFEVCINCSETVSSFV